MQQTVKKELRFGYGFLETVATLAPQFHYIFSMSDNQQKLKPLKLVPVPRLLDHIGLAMYSKFTKAIGELVVNGYDADATRVDVDIKSGEIVIKDNGSGMDEEGIREGYMLLGADTKRKIKKTAKFGRLPIGNKGIGKLAGLGIANKISITTVKNGKEFNFSIDREELKKVKTLEDAVFDDFTVRDTNKSNGTLVALSKILSHVKIDVENLKGNLAMDLPHDGDFKIFVNGQLCTRKDIPAKRKIPIDYLVEGCGNIKGEIIVAKKSFTSIPAGIVTTVRGRAVGKPSLFDVYKSKHRFYHSLAQLITGSVGVSAFDPEEETDERPVIQTDREGFVEDHPKYVAYHKFMTDLLLQICKEEEDEFNKKTEAEKEAKVKEALKNVIDDFNALNKEERQEVRGTKKSLLATKQEGDEEIIKKTEEDLHESKDQILEQQTNPVGITNKKKREELQGLIGEGSIHLGNKRYKVVTQPLGVDDYECRIDDEVLLVVINISHPAYDQAVAEKAVELTVFRAIADAFANKISQTPIEMYEEIDRMLRFQARRVAWRREKRSKNK